MPISLSTLPIIALPLFRDSHSSTVQRAAR